MNQHLTALSLPDEFRDKANNEILAYLKELKSSTAAEIFRMRVMIVGPGEAGKTTLVHRLLHDEYCGNIPMTDGVSMKEWQPRPDVNLSLWDFGGQQVYLNSHAMLFADKTLYLLVWSPRAGTDSRVLEEYLLNIRSRAISAPESPIILVTTRAREMKDIESGKWPEELSKYKYMCHHNIDSSDGQGISDLKDFITRFVTVDFADHSRVLVPGWYLALESKLKEFPKSKFSKLKEFPKSKFSLSRTEFNSLCVAVWKPSGLGKENVAIPASLDDAEFLQAAKTVLNIFHHWGVVFVLKASSDSGDVVLNPQDLADVFARVITCHADSTGAVEKSELFKSGILRHDLIGSIWSGYEQRLHTQFLALLHDCELCFEIFDQQGTATNCSLVPALLPKANDLSETFIRHQLFSSHHPHGSSNMVSEGLVKISFNCLLPNFFPKLIVRLRTLSSSAASNHSRHHLVVQYSEYDNVAHAVRSSLVCLVEDVPSKSLMLYPGGHSFAATGICSVIIRELLRESFAAMCVTDISFLADDRHLKMAKIKNMLSESCSPTITLDNGLQISLLFLRPWFENVTSTIVPPPPTPVTSTSTPVAAIEDAFSASPEDVSLLSVLQNCWSQFQASGEAADKFSLAQSVIQSIPVFRNHLGLSRAPGILWLFGHPTPPSCQLYLYAVSPSLIPGYPWEIVHQSEISLNLFHNSPTREPDFPVDSDSQLDECPKLFTSALQVAQSDQ